MKNFLPVEYKKNNTLKLNHSYLVEQFSDYSKIFKEIEKVVKRGDYTLGQKVNEFENLKNPNGSEFVSIALFSERTLTVSPFFLRKP